MEEVEESVMTEFNGLVADKPEPKKPKVITSECLYCGRRFRNVANDKGEYSLFCRPKCERLWNKGLR